MARLDPYVNFAGDAAEAMAFYQSVFGGKLDVIRFRDFGVEVPEAELDLVMHASVELPNGDFLMASDMPPSMGMELKVGNNSHIMIGVDSAEEALRLHDALSVGGEIHMAFAETDFAERYSNFKDRYGVHWMVYFGGSKT